MPDYEIPKKIDRYIKRVAAEYLRNGHESLASVLSRSRATVIPETAYDNWNGGINGHDVLFDVPDELMHHIPLDVQADIQNKIAKDLNQAATAASAEYINAVHFEFYDSDQSAVDGETIGRIWKQNTIKLFLSHRDTDKRLAHQIAARLDDYGVTTFVAHDSIKPDEQWQAEIEKALQSMDAMLVMITDHFFESPWTNQEIGFALGKNKPVISLKLSRESPVGFISNRQAINALPSDITNAADQVWDVLQRRLAGSSVVMRSLINRFVNARSFAAARRAFENIENSSTHIAPSDVEEIVNAFNSNTQISACWDLQRDNRLINFLNRFSPKTLILQDGSIKPESRDPINDFPF